MRLHLSFACPRIERSCSRRKAVLWRGDCCFLATNSASTTSSPFRRGPRSTSLCFQGRRDWSRGSWWVCSRTRDDTHFHTQCAQKKGARCALTARVAAAPSASTATPAGREEDGSRAQVALSDTGSISKPVPVAHVLLAMIVHGSPLGYALVHPAKSNPP